MTDVARECWCGANSLRRFSPGYLRCSACETLVSQEGLTDGEALVRDDEVDYYGKRYWLEHQREELDLPDIYTRVRQDLPERCVHWLEMLFRYRQPPATILEVGAGHGAYTALLRWAGYGATALDLSPWVAEFSRTRFGIPYLVGRVEDQSFDLHSFDVLVANDVLEHLPDPVSTVRAWLELLKPDGVLVLQTPEYQVGRNHDELMADGDPFLEHMGRASTEHLYLFSRPALELLLGRMGLTEIRFEKPMFSYDMFCAASAGPLQPASGDQSDLAKVGPVGPLVLALIDAHDAWNISERDRADRLVVIERLDAELRGLQKGQAPTAGRGQIRAAYKSKTGR
jgi:2-polyprenyl-3-methyl-5-hydroxy-6-metoxy-1,4-benzoquinol methylase